MARIFFSLATFALLLMTANLVVGLNTGDFNGAAQRLSQAERSHRLRRDSGAESSLDSLKQEYEQARTAFEPLRRRATFHIVLGLGAALVSVLVNSITVTYFIGTARWCREVSDAYALDGELAERSETLKRKAFPWSVLGILCTMAIVTIGAASDPSALGAERSSGWVSYHFLTAVVGIAAISYAFLRQVLAVGANYEVIASILGEVRRIRAAKGLE